MTDYSNTKKFTEEVVERHKKLLENLAYDYEDLIVIDSLTSHYDMVNDYEEPDGDLLWAISRVMEDYLTGPEYQEWLKKRAKTSGSKGFDEYGNYGENNPPIMSNPGDRDYEV